MPLTDPDVARELRHRRTLEIDGYLREDGLYDIEGHLLDVKGFSFDSYSHVIPAGTPIHQMSMRLVVDRDLVIRQAQASTDASPYPGSCETITPHYAQLEGLRIGPGFTRQVKERLGGLKGCAHLTELIGVLATVAFQTRYDPEEDLGAKKPPHLDGCHALDTRGSVVARFYPQWAVAPSNQSTDAGEGGAEAIQGCGIPVGTGSSCGVKGG